MKLRKFLCADEELFLLGWKSDYVKLMRLWIKACHKLRFLGSVPASIHDFVKCGEMWVGRQKSLIPDMSNK